MRFLEQFLFIAGPQTAHADTTTAATSLLPDAMLAGSKTVPANFLREGASIRMSGMLELVAGASPPTTLTLDFKMGGVSYGATNFGLAGMAGQTVGFHFDFLWTFHDDSGNKANGSSVIIRSQTGQSASASSAFVIDGTFDETAAADLEIIATFSHALTSGTSVRVRHARCTLLNP